MTLVNGKRMAPGTINGGSAANINNIPVALVKEVQIVTGGASSVYGSDAIGGVVNFILDDNFEGFKASYTHSFYNHKNEDSDMRAFVEAAGYPQAPGTVNEGDNKVWAVMSVLVLVITVTWLLTSKKEKEMEYYKVSMTYLLVLFGMVDLKLQTHTVAVVQVQLHGVDLLLLVAHQTIMISIMV
jgi:hypothetical protein